MDPLTKEQIEKSLDSLPGWEFVDDSIRKKFSFPDFRAALSFMVRAGFEAEDQVHHPEWTNVYNSVNVRLSTHDAGGKVTEKDIALANAMDEIYKNG